ncbi:M1 family metallopeptidase, partial [Paenibacillus sepulcri]|nr:M1 family metallopeptidase [Paenibacillus sepulcri]
QAANIGEAPAPVQYRIDARLDETNMHILGSETVTYRNTSKDTLRELVFHTYADANRSASTQSATFANSNKEILKNNPALKSDDFLGGIDIKEVAADGQPLTYNNANQAFTVQLKQELKPGEAASVQVSFDVTIPYGQERLSHYKDIINGAHWFPDMSIYNDGTHQWDRAPYSTTFESDYYISSDFQVHLNVPDSYQVLMPGTITTEEDREEAGRKTVSAAAANTREFVFFASPDYKVESVTRDGLTIEYYYFDNQPDKKKLVDRYIDQAFQAIGFFNEKYGKYPYPEFRIAESYVEGAAVEFSRAIQMGILQSKADPTKDTVFVHEIAHQWFHSLIGNNSEKESFLDEGFADFSSAYFFEKQGDALNGFQAVRFDESSFDAPVTSSNSEVGDLANPVFYVKGRQAIYQLYRTVGEEKFDAFMKEYFNRYEYKNASIDGLLQTVKDTLGSAAADEMDKSVHEPNFVLKQEYRLTDSEKAAYTHNVFQQAYESSLEVPDLPFETMSRIISKALQGEPVAIVLSDDAGDNEGQEKFVTDLKSMLAIFGIQPEVITGRRQLKSEMGKELAVSNIIAIGNAESNGLIQALKPGIIQNSGDIGFAWKDRMGKPEAEGAYIIKHPYNHDRLLLHFYWNRDKLNGEAEGPIAAQMSKVFNFTSDFYQYYEMGKTGKIISEKKLVNPISKFFAE